MKRNLEINFSYSSSHCTWRYVGIFPQTVVETYKYCLDSLGYLWPLLKTQVIQRVGRQECFKTNHKLLLGESVKLTSGVKVMSGDTDVALQHPGGCCQLYSSSAGAIAQHFWISYKAYFLVLSIEWSLMTFLTLFPWKCFTVVLSKEVRLHTCVLHCKIRV